MDFININYDIKIKAEEPLEVYVEDERTGHGFGSLTLNRVIKVRRRRWRERLKVRFSLWFLRIGERLMGEDCDCDNCKGRGNDKEAHQDSGKSEHSTDSSQAKETGSDSNSRRQRRGHKNNTGGSE